MHVRQYKVLLFYIILWSEQKCVAGNMITNSTVYCLMSVCSGFVMIVKFYIFSTVMHSRRRDVVLVWRVATLPMSCYIVRKITTKSVPQCYPGYLTRRQPLVALRLNVSTEFPFCTNSHLWHAVTSGSAGEGELGVFERHLLTRVSCHFAVFTPDGRSAINKGQRCSQPITDRLGLTVIQFRA